MTKISVNLNEVEEQKPVPADNYVVRIIKGEKATGKDSGAEYIAWEAEIVEGDHKGRHLFTNTSLKPSALWKLKQLLDEAKVVINKDGSFNTEDAIGSELIFVVGMREYEGRVRNEVNDYLAA